MWKTGDMILYRKHQKIIQCNMIRLSTDVLNTVLHLGVTSRLDLDKPVGVVIDALDETDRARLKDTATIFLTCFDVSRITEM